MAILFESMVVALHVNEIVLNHQLHRLVVVAGGHVPKGEV